jgi:hypothetical protein
VFENRVLRRIFAHKRDEIAGDWRNLYEDKFHNSCFSINVIRITSSMKMMMMMIRAGHVVCMRQKRNAYRIWVGKPERKETRRRREGRRYE